MLEAGEINLTCQAPVLLRIIAQTFQLVSDGDEVASKAVCSRYGQIVRKMLDSVDSNVLKDAFASLDPQEQQFIHLASQS